MAVNADKPHMWKADVARSIDWYNDWFVRYAPQAYLDARLQTAAQIEAALAATAQLTRITPQALRQNLRLLSLLRQATTPPLSRERLGGLAQVPVALIAGMERDGLIPPELMESVVDADLQRLGAVLTRLADRDIFPWLEHGSPLTAAQIHRAALIVADRLCVVSGDTIAREAQKQRQLNTIQRWLEHRGHRRVESTRRLGIDPLPPGTFALQLNMPVLSAGRTTQRAMPIDVALMPAGAPPGDLTLLVEARVAGDVTRANKKWAEDAAKIGALRSTYGRGMRYVLFLCGYFDSGYLGHAAAEGIDWVWEHRIEDLARLVGVSATLHEWPSEQAPAPEQRSAAPSRPTLITLPSA